MLKDFPKKKKIFNIAEMKEVEEEKARAEERFSDSSNLHEIDGSNCSLKTAFRSISDEFAFDNEPGKGKDGYVYNLGPRRFEGSGSSLGARLGMSHVSDERQIDEGFLSSKTRRHRRSETPEFKYESLSTSQKIELSRFCWSAFQSGPKNKFFSWVNCFYRGNVRSRRKPINPKVFEIIEVLRRKATHTRFIFRYEPNKSVAISIGNDLRDSKEIDCENIDTLVLANGLKNYIREHLDGLIPIEAFEKIKSCIITNDKHRKKALFSYIPFIFTDIERNLLRSLFDLFREIDRNQKETEMTLDSLLGLFSLVLHPQAAFTTLEDLDHVQTIMKEVYYLDFDVIPQAVVVHELVFV